VKILDRYITISVLSAFLFGIAIFLGLILTMDQMRKLVEMIAEQGVPVLIALQIIGYRIPSMLTYAFPMSVLLSILLTFNRMSSESEMVAARAAGISFTRIVMPTLFFALCVTGLTFLIADQFAPWAGKRASELQREALNKVQMDEPVVYQRVKDGKRLYEISAANLDLFSNRMRDVSLLFYRDGRPWVYINAREAVWNTKTGRWTFHPPFLAKPVDPDMAQGFTVGSDQERRSALDITTLTMRLEESPFDLTSAKRRTDELTAEELRRVAAHLRELDSPIDEVGKWEMGFLTRYATPFSCLVFALIGAPLGLRHHRTSSAVGLGISLLVIFGFYFFSVYLGMVGENGRIPPALAAWLPNLLGALVGIGLIMRANR